MSETCNINTREIQQRYTIAAGALLVTLFWMLFVTYFEKSIWWHVLIFFPLFGAVLSYIQARRKFCVNYGFRGIANKTETSLERVKVNEEIFHKSQQYAYTLTMQALALTAIMTGVYILILKLLTEVA